MSRLNLYLQSLSRICLAFLSRQGYECGRDSPHTTALTKEFRNSLAQICVPRLKNWKTYIHLCPYIPRDRKNGKHVGIYVLTICLKPLGYSSENQAQRRGSEAVSCVCACVDSPPAPHWPPRLLHPHLQTQAQHTAGYARLTPSNAWCWLLNFLARR